jgi:hypothetical protein
MSKDNELKKLTYIDNDSYYKDKPFINTDPLDITTFRATDFNMLVPELALPYLPKLTLKQYPTHFCGAGKGLSEWVIPDVFWFFWYNIKISPACLVHDLEYALAPPTWDAFRAADSRLQTNINSIIEQFYDEGCVRKFFKALGAIYLLSTDTFGKYVFWELKKKQGHTIPSSAKWYVGVN